MKRTKKELAEAIERHHLFTGRYNSKRYYKYSSAEEIRDLMKKPKIELQDMYDMLYDECGRQLTQHEINY